MTQQVPARPRIVVGIDTSLTSIAAARWAKAYAEEIGGAQLRFVSAWQPIVQYNGWIYTAEMDRELVVWATKNLKVIVDALFDGHPPDDCEQVVQRGRASRVLVDASEGAKCLVVGNRGHSGFASAFLGSVSAECAAHAHCPVVIIHEQALAEAVQNPVAPRIAVSS